MVIDSVVTKQEILLLAEQVEAGHPGGESQADSLRTLAEAVDGVEPASDWASVDLFRAFNAEGLARQLGARPAHESWLPRLEWIRNALFLAPLLVTWFALFVALEAFETAVGKQPELASQPFLYLWQSGFGGRLPWLTFSHVALLDSIIIASILVLTLVVYVWSGQGRKERDTSGRKSQSEISRILTNASICLARRTIVHPDRFAAEFDDVARRIIAEIGKERERLEELRGVREKELSDLQQFSRDLATSTGDLLRAAHLTLAAAEAAAAAASSIAGAIDVLSGAVGELGRLLPALTQGLSGLAVTQIELRDATVGAGERLGRLVEGEELVGSRIGNALSKMEVSLQQVATTTSQANAVAEGLARGQEGLIAALAKEREAQSNTARVISHTNVTLEGTLRGIQSYATTLHTVAVDLQTLARTIPETSGRLQTESARLFAAQSESARRVADAGASMEASAQSVAQVVGDLVAAVDGLVSDCQGLSAAVAHLEHSQPRT